MNKRLILAGTLILLSIIIFAIFYLGNQPLQVSRSFSNHETLQNTWQDYKEKFITKEGLPAQAGRTIDPDSSQGQEITTSEGQSYGLLRAVWMSDKETFDSLFSWTKNNLQQQDTHLFSWLYGKKPDGSLGVLTEKGGGNTASDADTDIALSLIFAYARWNDPAYLAEAQNILNGIWDHEVVTINYTPYMTANNLEANSPKPLINPSYLAPYAYRIFASVDRKHDWGKLVESSYRVINESIYSPLDKDRSANLPPNWVRINKATEKLEAAGDADLSTDYGFDAMRLPWRISLDANWYGDPRAKEVLYRMGFLAEEWKNRQFLFSTYSHDGKVVQNSEWPSIYGGSLGYFIATDPVAAEQIFSEKLQMLYNPSTKTWKKELSYYDSNWAWFGMALYFDELPNLAKASVF